MKHELRARWSAGLERAAFVADAGAPIQSRPSLGGGTRLDDSGARLRDEPGRKRQGKIELLVAQPEGLSGKGVVTAVEHLRGGRLLCRAVIAARVGAAPLADGLALRRCGGIAPRRIPSLRPRGLRLGNGGAGCSRCEQRDQGEGPTKDEQPDQVGAEPGVVQGRGGRFSGFHAVAAP